MELITERVVSSVVVAMSSDRVACGRLMAIVHLDLIIVALRKQALIGGLRHISIPEEFDRGKARKELDRRSAKEVRLS